MYEFKFPDVGEGITEGELIKWLVKEGDHVSQDQPIAEVETDKAVVQIPSPVAGAVVRLYFKEKDTIHVGDVIVTLSEGNETVAKKEEPVSLRKKSFGVVGEIEEAPDEEEKKEVATPVVETKKAVVLATPAVRGLAKKLGVDIEKITGTGPGGRVIEGDLKSVQPEARELSDAHAIETPRAQSTRKYDDYGHVERTPFKGIRKATANKLSTSWAKAVHVTHMDEIDVTDLTGILLKESARAAKQGIKLTFMPFIIKAVIASMKEGHASLNSTLDEEREEIILKKYYNIGFAVDTPDGLLAPVVKGADEKSILDIAKDIQKLAEACRNRKVDLGDLKGGTFTLTNVGSLGGVFATPIINYPEAAILALGRVYDKPVFVKNKLAKRNVLPVSLTFDHRILDGAEACRFVNTIKEHLQDPSLLLVERD